MKQKKIQVSLALAMMATNLLPAIVYADARSEAQNTLKNDFSSAINAFTGVFQYLSYGVAVLAIIVVSLSGLLLHDEQAIKRTKQMGTWVIVLAIVAGVAATLITLATNKNG